MSPSTVVVGYVVPALLVLNGAVGLVTGHVLMLGRGNPVHGGWSAVFWSIGYILAGVSLHLRVCHDDPDAGFDSWTMLPLYAGLASMVLGMVFR